MSSQIHILAGVFCIYGWSVWIACVNNHDINTFIKGAGHQNLLLKDPELSLLPHNMTDRDSARMYRMALERNCLPIIPGGFTENYQTDSFQIYRNAMYERKSLLTPDSHNINNTILSIRKSANDEFISIDLKKENPFIEAGMKMRRNPYPDNFYFFDISDEQKFKAFDDKFSANISADSRVAETREVYCMYGYDISSNSHLVVYYEVVLNDRYEEPDGFGYGISQIQIYNTLGSKIFEKELPGIIIDNPLLSPGGKYLFLHTLNEPFWDEAHFLRFLVIDVPANRIVYENRMPAIDRHFECFIHYSKEVDKITAKQQWNMDSCRIYTFDIHEQQLYKIKADLEGVFFFKPCDSAKLLLYPREGSISTLSYKTDFEIVRFK